MKVEEPAAGGFLWVLMEACDMHGSEVFHYRVVRKAPHPQAAYWDAMVLGMAELRRTMAVDAALEVERQS